MKVAKVVDIAPGVDPAAVQLAIDALYGLELDEDGVAAFLASSASDFISGTAIPVDGGFSIAM